MIPSGSLTPDIDPDAFGLPAGTALRYERPAPELRSLVPSYAVLDSDVAVFKGPSSWVLPGWAQLWIGLTRGTVTVRARKRQPSPLGAAMLFGNTSMAMPATSQGGVTIVVDLSPMGWARWFDQPADEVRDQIVPLDRFWSAARVNDLIERLHRSDRGESVKPILDEFLLSSLPAAHRDEPALAALCRSIADEQGLAIGDVAKAMNQSQGTLLRLANRYLGFSPKVLMRRTRFLRAITAMLVAEGGPPRGVVPPGYHDVPHFLRDGREFLGLTPRRFLTIPLPYLRAVLRARTMVIGAPLPLLDRTIFEDR